MSGEDKEKSGECSWGAKVMYLTMGAVIGVIASSYVGRPERVEIFRNEGELSTMGIINSNPWTERV